MAEPWVATRRKTLVLNALAFAARVAPGITGGRRDPAPSSAGVRKILVVELWNIGDVVLTLPFLAQLRAHFPAARITLLGRAHAREVLAGSGLVDDFIVADLGWTESTSGAHPLAYPWRQLLRLRRTMVDRQFDLAFQARPHVREHVLLALSRAKYRVGVSLGDNHAALTHPVRRDLSGSRRVDDWLALLEPFGGPVPAGAPTLTLDDSERGWAAEFLRARGVGPSDELIGIHPGASLPEKRWPLARFAEVARVLSGSPGTRVLWFVDPAGYGASGESVPGVITVAADLRRLMALLARCRLLVCNDSGPMHLAAALGVPCVAVFGPGISRWFSPLGEGHQLVSATPRPDRFQESAAAHGGIDTVAIGEVLEAIARVRSSSARAGNGANQARE